MYTCMRGGRRRWKGEAKSDKNYHAATPFQFRLIRAGSTKIKLRIQYDGMKKRTNNNNNNINSNKNQTKPKKMGLQLYNTKVNIYIGLLIIAKRK